MKSFKIIILAAVFFIAAPAAGQHTLVTLWKSADSLAIPESVLPYKKELYVSLIDGKGNEKDGKGGIAILNKDGTTKNMHWVTGLNAPKGLGVYKNKLYVADLTDIVVININSGVVEKTIPVPGSVFLNDIAIDKKGIVYVSDTREHKIHRLVKDKPELYLDNVTNANGLKVINQELYVLAGKELWKIDRNKNKTIITSGFEQGGDGIEPVNNGDFLVTCWAGLIYYVHADGRIDKLMDVQGTMNTADLGFDPVTKIVYVPTFNAKSVIAMEVK